MDTVRLDPSKVVLTAERLQQRVDERFPASGLGKVCARLVRVASESGARTDAMSRPIPLLRGATVGLAVLMLAGLMAAAATVELPQGSIALFDLISIAESAVNDLVFIGIAIAFTVTLERRVKRGRALEALQGLRSLAHIIDMHQLTKDPSRLLASAERTEASPRHDLGAYALRRYLDYCSEMLSVVGKIAALYAQGIDDDVVLASVNQVEDLTTGLSRKIWQKIMILDSLEAPQPAPQPGPTNAD